MAKSQFFFSSPTQGLCTWWQSTAAMATWWTTYIGTSTPYCSTTPRRAKMATASSREQAPRSARGKGEGEDTQEGAFVFLSLTGHLSRVRPLIPSLHSLQLRVFRKRERRRLHGHEQRRALAVRGHAGADWCHQVRGHSAVPVRVVLSAEHLSGTRSGLCTHTSVHLFPPLTAMKNAACCE